MKIEKRNKIIETKFSHLVAYLIKAIKDYKMLDEKDRVLVAVSGGKDSLSALHLLDYLYKNKIFNFHILACNVELGYGCASRYVLENHFREYAIPYVFVEKNILKGITRNDINCFWCSWNRRKALFETANKYNCNKISLGHHLDDIIHTALMNMFFYGELSTAIPYLPLFGGIVAIIRPLCYVGEEETKVLAKELNLPLPCCACPQKPTSKRTLVKYTFSSLFEKVPQLKRNVLAALKNIKASQKVLDIQ